MPCYIAALDKRFGLFQTIVHTNHHMPVEVVRDFSHYGPEWCEAQVPGAGGLIAKYGLVLPRDVEQHDLSEAERLTGWTPKIGFAEFLRDLQARDARGEVAAKLWAPGQLPV